MGKKNRTSGSETKTPKSGPNLGEVEEGKQEVRGRVETELSPGEKYTVLGCYNITIDGSCAKHGVKLGGDT